MKKKALQLFIVVFSMLLVSAAFYQPSRFYHSQPHKVSKKPVKIVGLNLIEEHREGYSTPSSDEMPLHGLIEALEQEEEDRAVYKKHLVNHKRIAPILSAIKYYSFYKEPLISQCTTFLPQSQSVAPHLGISISKDIGLYLI